MDKSFEQQYQEGYMPWDHGMPDRNLIEVVERFQVKACPVLDIGCGTCDNALWLADRGFKVLGCDLSETALRMASEKEGIERVELSVRDILIDPFAEQSFGFIFDRGCFHSIEGEEDRTLFVKHAASMLKGDGLWLSLIGNADELRRENGPPQMTAREITGLAEPFFEILLLESGVFGSDQEDPPRAWICLMKKRK